MTLYAIEDKTCLTICEEAEIVNHTDWAALHICKTKTAALDTVLNYMDNSGYSWIGTTCRRYGWTVIDDSYVCYHNAVTGEWVYAGEGEDIRISELRKADAIMAGGAYDEMAWAADPQRVTVYLMDGDSLRVDIDVNELADDCEAVDLAALDRRTADELSIIRIPPTPLTAKQTAERCAHYLTYSLRRFPEVAAAALAAIADPANDGRWTDADSVRDIVWPIVTAINNPPTEQAAAPTQEAQDAPQDGDSTEGDTQEAQTDEAPQDAPQAVRDDATTQGAGTPRTTAA